MKYFKTKSTSLTNWWKNFVKMLATCLLVSYALTACKTVQQTAQNTQQTYQTKKNTDSTAHRDSIYTKVIYSISTRHDTIFNFRDSIVYVERFRDKYVYVNDTIVVTQNEIRTESITTNKLNRIQRFFFTSGILAFAILVFYLIFKLRKFISL